jgi:hypothetical protein
MVNLFQPPHITAILNFHADMAHHELSSFVSGSLCSGQTGNIRRNPGYFCELFVSRMYMIWNGRVYYPHWCTGWVGQHTVKKPIHFINEIFADRRAALHKFTGTPKGWWWLLITAVNAYIV